MNKNISEEELMLRKRARRRLVGAIVLVVFSVIVLPIFFDEPKPDNEHHDIAIHLPATIRDAEPIVLPNSDLGYSGFNETASIIEPDLTTELEDRNELVIDQAKIESKPLQNQGYAPIPRKKPKVAAVRTVGNNSNNTAPAPVTNVGQVEQKGFVVQLGAYTDPAKARQQQENLIFQGFKAYTETLKVDNNQMTRVRIGPFATRNLAENELKALKKHGLDGVVTTK